MPFHLDSFNHLSQAELVAPSPVPDPYWVGFSDKVAALLNIDTHGFLPIDPQYLQLLAGNQQHIEQQTFQPYATAYSGHQFGQWAGQLGDGRAIYLGDINGFEVQLKGKS